MRRVTVSLDGDLEDAAIRFQRDQDVPPTLNAMAQVALREFLGKRGYLPSGKKFYIAPMVPGSGYTDTSINHDQINDGVAEMAELPGS
jgi:hypothetical protein